MDGSVRRRFRLAGGGRWTGCFGGVLLRQRGIVSHGAGFGLHLRGDQITVNAVAPGQVETPMLMTDLAPEVLEAVTKGPPLGWVASPGELGGVVVFLAVATPRS